MPDFKLTFQEEVRRLARKEVKAANEILAAQQKTIRELTKRIEALEKKQAVPIAQKADKPEEPAVAVKSGKARFSPKTIIKFRKKYGISQKGFAALLGVATFTVSHWELGKNRPRATQVAAISALTKLGKRKVAALLAEKAPAEVAKKPAKPAKATKPAKAAKLAKKAKAPKTAKTVAVPAPAVATDKVITVKP
jgi:DNA-binding transcriptional regulator YiaG